MMTNETKKLTETVKASLAAPVTNTVHPRGKSKSAALRAERASRGVTHTGTPGQVVKMSGGRHYFVEKDGSFRRMERA